MLLVQQLRHSGRNAATVSEDTVELKRGRRFAWSLAYNGRQRENQAPAFVPLAPTSALVYCVVIINRHSGFLMVRPCPGDLFARRSVCRSIVLLLLPSARLFSFDLPLNSKLSFFKRREPEKFRGETAAR